MQFDSLPLNIIEGLSLVVLGVLGVWLVVAAILKKARFPTAPQKFVAPAPGPSGYRIEPFPLPNYGELLRLARFQDLLRRYSMDSDNGTSIWASADGYWVDAETGAWVRVNVGALRAGVIPEQRFTHIWFMAK